MIKDNFQRPLQDNLKYLKMKITLNSVVSLSYDLYAGDAGAEKNFVESATSENPMTFIFGIGGLIPTFEANVDGLTIGDKFAFDINAADAYGNREDNALVELPKDVFMMDGKVEEGLLEVGNMVPMSDNQGNRLIGKILEVNETNVKMDFNHELAGKDLRFEGEILEVREATAEELDHGHVHDGDGHHHAH